MKIPFSFLLILCFLCAGPAFLAAQNTAVEIETLLASEALTYAQAARFVLEAAEAAAIYDPLEAFHFARERNWLPGKTEPDAPARLDNISLLVMQSFGFRGGILYTLTRSPHSAYREMEHRDFIQGRISPSQKVSGDTLLFMVGRVLGYVETKGPTAAQIERQRLFAEEAARLEAQRKADREASLAADREALVTQINTLIEEQKVTDVYVAVTNEGVMFRLSDIQFSADSAEIPRAEMARLNEVAEILKGIPGRRIEVAGHTAMAGTEENRLRISSERAQAVADYLVSLGARSAREISSIGFGASRPVASNDTPEGMAANRRVEITILGN